MRAFGVELEYGTVYDTDLWDLLRDAGRCSGHRCLNLMTDRWTVRDKNRRHKDYWVIKPESSNLVEINTPAISDYRVLLETLPALLEGFKGTTNHNCGFHVHVDARKADVLALALLFLRFARVQKWLFKLHPRYEARAHYCLPILEKDIRTLIGEIDRGEADIDSLVCAFGSKDTALSLAPYMTYGTIEIRLAPSTDKAETVAYWAGFCQAFVTETLSDLKLGKWHECRTYRGFINTLRLPAPIRTWALSKGRSFAQKKNRVKVGD